METLTARSDYFKLRVTRKKRSLVHFIKKRYVLILKKIKRKNRGYINFNGSVVLLDFN